MAPTKEQYQAALSALRDDARQWSDAAAELGAAGTTAGGLALDARAISSVGDELGVTQIYTELQQKLARLLERRRGFGRSASTCSRFRQFRRAADPATSVEVREVFRRGSPPFSRLEGILPRLLPL